MALYAFDGTWNEKEPDPVDSTNVLKFRNAYKGKAYYIDGVGTRFGPIGRVLGGVFGAGGQTRIEEMYAHLVSQVTNGDTVVDIIGFSRGAALAVHFANLIQEIGIVDEEERQIAPAPQIRFLGLWDTVGSFGIPRDFILNFQKIDIGYDLDAPGHVDICYHAMAIHERCQSFVVYRLNRDRAHENIHELWFRGVHSDVGGGNGNTALSDITLYWMMDKAIDHGLPISENSRDEYDTGRPRAAISKNFDPIEDPRRTIEPQDRFYAGAVGKPLGIGESATFTVRAPDLYSWSGVHLEEGQHYTFAVDPSDTWTDASIQCGADGWSTEQLSGIKEIFVRRFEDDRRYPEAQWFELIGAIGETEDKIFRIGSRGEATLTAPVSGNLFAFANDLKSKYDNNSGELEVTVTRVSEPAAERLAIRAP